MSDTAEKEVKLKTNIVKRILTDIRSYEDELRSLKNKVDELEGTGGSDTSQWRAAVHETEMMIPESKFRLTQAFSDLKATVEKAESEGLGVESLGDAKKVLSEAT